MGPARSSISLDRTLAAVLAAYSVLLLWLHVVNPTGWAVDFVPGWGRVAMVAAYLGTFVISPERAARAVADAVSRAGSVLPPVGRSLAWLIPVFAGLWLGRHTGWPSFGDGGRLLNRITNEYRYDPQSPLGVFVQSILYSAGHREFGLTSEQTWAFTSVVWGLVFVPALISTCRELFGDGRPAVVTMALIATQATSKYYFGYIEDYVAPSVLVLLYARAAGRALRGETDIAAPGLLLGLALVFSMANVFLVPSLAWLAFECLRARDRPVPRFIWATGSCLVPLLLTLGGFHWIFGVDVIALSQSSHAARLSDHLAPLQYAGVWPQFLDLASLHLLVAPLSLLLVLLLLVSPSGRAALREPQARFLAVLGACGLAMGVVWFPSLGMFSDWDLFALFATPVSLFAGCLLARSSAEPALRPHLDRALVLTVIHTYFWIRV